MVETLYNVPVNFAVRRVDDASVQPEVRGFLHLPQEPSGAGLVLTHGAGADCRSRLLTALAEEFATAGIAVLRCDLPFRQKRPHGPPFPGAAAADREGLRRALTFLKTNVSGRLFLGGHSYGGRQASMLVADDYQLAAGLLLLSYPLHPPRRPAELRTSHFPQLTTSALFVHGSRDAFGSEDEFRAALKLIPGRTSFMEIPGSGHELLPRKSENDLPARILRAFQEFFIDQ